ncbi:MAG: HEAT repeat domain-containing protein [Gemmataceae bacterium]|nr:HEAT repeat domain-containing protein [Gemmataceae bacterium]
MGMTALLVLVAPLLGADEPKLAASLEISWYSPLELMTQLGKRDGIRWAMPESLAGRALVGGESTVQELLDNACEQWGLHWTVLNRVIVIHKAHAENLKRWSGFLSAGKETAAVAAWELGWLRDARALSPLTEALLSDDPAIALAAARAINLLAREVPIGRDERVEPMPTGRVSLAAAFPLPAGLAVKLDSPYPSVRAAALRLFLAHGGKEANAAEARTEKDASILVRQVRQQCLFTPSPDLKAKPTKWEVLLPLPKDLAEVKAACARMIDELPGLEKRSGWEEMQHRVRIMAAWSKAGSEPAADALIDLTGTKLQFGWFPGFVQMELAATGNEKVTAKLKDLMPKANQSALVRGLEQSYAGDALLAFTRPYLAEQTLCYVTARKAGREVLDDLQVLAAKGNFAAIDSIGIIGGPKAVPVLKTLLNRDGPESVTLAFRAAKALGNVGSPEAADALMEASKSDSRLHRHAAALFLGRSGGPKVEACLIEASDKDPERLVRAAAADALEQIGGGKNLAAVAKFRKADAPVPVATHQPRNPRFGADFPVNEWVNLKIRIEAFAEFGEMGWNYDAANKLFFRYGGCSGYTNELTVFDLGTEQFTQRRPNEEMAGWEDRRPPRGCSGGRTWDPYRKAAWIGPSIGGTASDLAIAEYYNKDGGYRFSSYDLATDRFRPAPFHQAPYGEATNRYAFDWKNGLLYPVKFQHVNHKTKDWWALDTRSADPYAEEAWLNKTNPPGDYPRHTGYTIATVDQNTGLLVVYVPPFDSRPPETWTYDPKENLWKSMEPKVQPSGQAGAGLVYDPFHKLIVLQSGKSVTQFGGPDDSITWSYDVRTNTWTDLKPKGGPGNPWVGAMDFDPEHNVFVVFNHRDRSVWAYRFKTVPVGTAKK